MDTHIQPINDDFVDCIRVSSHSCGNLPPVSQPHILSLVDEGRVIIQLVVQNHIEAIPGKQADDKHVAVKGGSKAIQVVTAEAWGSGRLILQADKIQTSNCRQRSTASDRSTEFKFNHSQRSMHNHCRGLK